MIGLPMRKSHPRTDGNCGRSVSCFMLPDPANAVNSHQCPAGLVPQSEGGKPQDRDLRKTFYPRKTRGIGLHPVFPPDPESARIFVE